MRAVAGIVIAILLSGCASSPVKWGSNATIAPGWRNLADAAVKAARDPGTWIPAVGAVGFYASGQDERIAHDLLENTPVYGSRGRASEVSDEHAILLDRLWVASVLVADSGTEHWFSNKVKGFAVQGLTVNFSQLTTNVLKKAVRRREPSPYLEHVEYEAFPSNHGVAPFTHVALIRRNLDYTGWSGYATVPIMLTAYALAGSAAYGRVESGLHHVSDQLAGAAIGNFIGLTLHDAFMGDDRSFFTLTPMDRGRTLVASYRYAW